MHVCLDWHHLLRTDKYLRALWAWICTYTMTKIHWFLKQNFSAICCPILGNGNVFAFCLIGTCLEINDTLIDSQSLWIMNKMDWCSTCDFKPLNCKLCYFSLKVIWDSEIKKRSISVKSWHETEPQIVARRERRVWISGRSVFGHLITHITKTVVLWVIHTLQQTMMPIHAIL